jgi:UDP-N-acetylmuramyl pentapeptide phosphotransferase/UDP-N-acetylglucosamine-1-phosphate transferase
VTLGASLGPALTALVTSIVVTFGLITLLPRLGFLDVPNDRSSHVAPVPRGGGLAVLGGVVVGVLVAGAPDGSLPATLLAAAAGGLGLLDDRLSLSIQSRLLAQTALAVAAAALLVATTTLSAWAVVGLVVLWVAFVNAFNFMDGINAISALVAIVAAGWFVLIGPDDLRVLGWVVAAATAGFLVFNAAGRVFLGDVGSYALGSLLWSMTVLLLDSGAGVVESVTPMALYGVETAVAVVVLVRSGGRPGQAHRLHAYQRLVDSGLSHLVVAVVAAVVLTVMLAAVRLVSPSWLGAIVALIVATAYVWSPTVVRRAAPSRSTRIESS